MSWSTNTNFPYGINGPKAISYNGKVYITGGYYWNGYLNTTISYDPSTDSYDETLATLNTARAYHSIGISGSIIIAAGGLGSSSDSVEIYDIEADSWTTKTSMPGVNARTAGTVYGDYFYVFGGDIDAVYKYDINDDSWTTEDTSIGVGTYPTVETVGEFIWVIGGFGDKTAVRKYNPSTNNWVSGSYTTAPSDVDEAASCVRGTKIYIAGGLDGSTNDSFISYDTATDTWDTLTDLPTARYHAAGAKVDNNFYVIGGWGYLNVNESFEFDIIAPSDITDLTVTNATAEAIDLEWTAPGDDGVIGTASTYDIRYSTSAINNDTDFDNATEATGEPSPSIAGSTESFIVDGLDSETQYYFAIKTADEVPNWSGLSHNEAQGTTTDITAPADISDLATATADNAPFIAIKLTWTAPGDDGVTGTADQYDIRYSKSPITPANWAAATQATGEPTPQAAGSSESFTVTGLDVSTQYYFAIRTADEVPNWSNVSNSPSGSTDTNPGGDINPFHTRNSQ